MKTNESVTRDPKPVPTDWQKLLAEDMTRIIMKCTDPDRKPPLASYPVRPNAYLLRKLCRLRRGSFHDGRDSKGYKHTEGYCSRQRVLDTAHLRHPDRFVRKAPAAPALPEAVWINPPEKTKEPKSEAQEISPN